MFRESREAQPITKESLAQIPVLTPTWGRTDMVGNVNDGKIKATWLGHACFLVELPSPSLGTPSTSSNASRGARILFDPVFSDRCSPTQLFGPKRYTSEFQYMWISHVSESNLLEPPCAIEDIPEVDALVISVSVGSPIGPS